MAVTYLQRSYLRSNHNDVIPRKLVDVNLGEHSQKHSQSGYRSEGPYLSYHIHSEIVWRSAIRLLHDAYFV